MIEGKLEKRAAQSLTLIFLIVRWNPNSQYASLLWRLTSVIHVHAHDLTTVFTLTGHEIKVRLIRLCGHATACRIMHIVL